MKLRRQLAETAVLCGMFPAVWLFDLATRTRPRANLRQALAETWGPASPCGAQMAPYYVPSSGFPPPFSVTFTCSQRHVSGDRWHYGPASRPDVTPRRWPIRETR